MGAEVTMALWWMRSLVLALFAALAVTFWPLHAIAQDVSVRTFRAGESFEIEGRAELRVARELVWQVVTDYERLPEFIPGLLASQVLSRTRDSLVLAQRGELRFLFFTFPIEVKLQVEEQPFGSVVSKAIGGNVRAMRGRYDLVTTTAGTEFIYHGSISADLGLPAFIVEPLVRAHAQAQFSAMVREILRRAGLPVVPAGSDP